MKVKSDTTTRPVSRKAQRLNSLATAIAYDRFCHLNSSYHHTMANQLQIMRWIDERRIEMLAEGRPHWVPTQRDYWLAMWDCWDDLVKPEVRQPNSRLVAHSSTATPATR